MHINAYKGEIYYDNSSPTKKEEQGDMVNHPKHYKRNGFEVIDIIEAFTEGLEGIEATDTGNAIKYILRWSDKNGIEDLKKCIWYINHLIKKLEDKNDIQKVEEKCQEFIVNGEPYNLREKLYFHDQSVNHFKCPECGGNIIRKRKYTNNSTKMSETFEMNDAECESCGKLYFIRINQDMSYEITGTEIAKYTDSIMERL